MNVFRFESYVTDEGDLHLPPDVRLLLGAHTGQVQVMLLVRDRDDDDGWEALTAAEFLAGYDEADSIYEAIV